LFAQFLAVDSGVRLGTSRRGFCEKFFHETGWGVASRYEIDVGAETRIQELIGDMTLQMSAEDYLDLPPINFNDIWVDLPPKAQAQYEKLERDMFMEMDSGTEVEVFNAAALTIKCLQAASGLVYVETGGPSEYLHDAKLEALKDIVEEQSGQPLIVAYDFISNAKLLQETFKGTRWYSSKLKEKEAIDLEKQWNLQKVSMLLGHPKSFGHGLNLQLGSDTLVFYGSPWSLEQYLQTIDRIAGGLRRHRPVMIHRILARNTVDVAVLAALEAKATTQDGLKSALNEYRRAKSGLGPTRRKSHPAVGALPPVA